LSVPHRFANDSSWATELLTVGDGVVHSIDVRDFTFFTEEKSAFDWVDSGSFAPVISPTNAYVDHNNEQILASLPGRSSRSVARNRFIDNTGVDPAVLDTLTNVEGIRQQILLKSGCFYYINRNFNVPEGICNGALVKLVSVSKHVVQAILCSSGDIIFIPRIRLRLTSGILEFSRTQYPLAPAHSSTVHKAQGETLKRVLIDVRSAIFSHGMLYVALSRSPQKSQVAFLIAPGNYIVNNIIHKRYLRITLPRDETQ
jgi:hypothetical protein